MNKAVGSGQWAVGSIRARLFTLTLMVLACGATVQAQGERPQLLRRVGIEQRLNAQVPLDLVFRDEEGRSVHLGDYFNGKPVVLSLAYYKCPMLCTQVLNGLTGSLKTLAFDIGDQYNVITVSFNPRDSSNLAAAKKEAYLLRYNRPGAERGWHFLTGDETSIKALTDAVGFHYAYDEKLDQYAHASGILLLTPQGRVARYFYGIEYKPLDLRLGLIEAAQNKIGSPVDQLLLFCYHYDPATGKYGPVVMNMLRLGGIITVVVLAALILLLRPKVKAPAPTKPGYTSLCLAPALLLPFMPDQASTVAGEVDALYLFLAGLTVFFTVLIAGLEIYYAVVYRRRSPDEIPRPILGSLSLELMWTIIPFLISMGIFAWGARLYFTLYRPPREAQEIYVTAKQWMWKFQHPEGQREINELHVPLGRRIKLVMTSEDVIHSFYVPDFRVKSDVLPGTKRYTTVWFEATKTGRFHIFCAEYCGTNHSGMIGWVVVMEPEEYQAWLGGGEGVGTMSASGESLFQSLGCATCHLMNGQGQGPSLQGVFGKPVTLQSGQKVVADESYIRESIINPQAKVVAGYQPIMPTFQGLVGEEQLLQLVAYVKSLGTTQATAASAPAGSSSPGSARKPAEAKSQRSNPLAPNQPPQKQSAPKQ
ncbi:MAG TPA: cytochrome c oxidase subunit II [Blastocatellia bacterium]|nr:cytochrome c oxidase subunit II [Blastocatellia bacterium]